MLTKLCRHAAIVQNLTSEILQMIHRFVVLLMYCWCKGKKADKKDSDEILSNIDGSP